jgi:hypothetical protein
VVVEIEAHPRVTDGGRVLVAEQRHQRRAEGVEIALGGGGTLKLLRRHIAERAHHGAAEAGVGGQRVAHGAKVDQAHGPRVVDDQVRWLDVAVDDRGRQALKPGQDPQDLPGDLLDLGLGPAPARLDARVQRLARRELLDQHHPALALARLRGRHEVDVARDPRVLEPRQDPRLALEELHGLPVVQVPDVEDLRRDLTPGLEVVSGPRGREAALAEQPLDPVTPRDDVPDAVSHGRKNIRRREQRQPEIGGSGD